MTMTAQDFRSAHLAELIAASGGVELFAVKSGFSQSYISQLKTGHRGIGAKTARKIEAKLNLPRGCMDLPPHGSSDLELKAMLSTVPEEVLVKAVSSSLSRLSPEGLRALSAAFLSQLTAPEPPQE